MIMMKIKYDMKKLENTNEIWLGWSWSQLQGLENGDVQCLLPSIAASWLRWILRIMLPSKTNSTVIMISIFTIAKSCKT